MILWQILPLKVSFIMLMGLMTITGSKVEMLKKFFVLDKFGLMMSFMPVFMLYSIYSCMKSSKNTMNIMLIMMSCCSSCLCFMSKKFMLFFLTYELSMMSLLFSLFMNSPYSERSMAGWYFLGYLVFGGMPLLILCLYLSLDYSKIYLFSINKKILFYGLFMMFISKVPLFPFHAWLPMVHAEANSFISMLLSGYMMKLGLLGVIRFMKISLEDMKFYLFMFFFVGCIFFMSCFCELDKKRWLAFLSLGHISVVMGGAFSLSVKNNYMLGCFSLGHGMSVFILFYYFHWYSLKSGSRKWIMNMYHNKKMNKILMLLGMMSLMAFPPCMLFFKEMSIFISMSNMKFLMMLFSLYLFLNMFGPMSVLSVVLSRLSKAVVYNMSSKSLMMLMCSLFLFFSSCVIL